jgi:hypothetical protein
MIRGEPMPGCVVAKSIQQGAIHMSKLPSDLTSVTTVAVDLGLRITVTVHLISHSIAVAVLTIAK